MPSRELVALEQIGLCCATEETATQLVQPAAQGYDSQCGFWRACSQQVQLEDRLRGSKVSRCAVSSRRERPGHRWIEQEKASGPQENSSFWVRLTWI